MWGIAAILGAFVKSEEEKKAEKEHVMAVIGARVNLQSGLLSSTSTAASNQAIALQGMNGLGASTFGGTCQRINPSTTNTSTATTMATSFGSMSGTAGFPPSPTGIYQAHYNAYYNTTTVTDGLGTILWIVDHNNGTAMVGTSTVSVDVVDPKPKKDAGERYHELVEKVDVLEGKLSIKDTPSTDDLLDHLEFRVSEIERKLADIEAVDTLIKLTETKAA